MITSNQKGFTILELLIATTVFSVILLIVTTGIIKVGNIYYKSITSSKTQEAARSITSDFSSTFQFANGFKQINTSPPSGALSFCLGDVRYTYIIDSKYTKGNEFSTGLYSEDLATGSNCVTGTVIDKRQLLGNNMRVLALNVSQHSASTDQLWDINLRIAYGDNDLLTHYDNSGTFIPSVPLSTATCKSSISGSSFCAVAQLDTLVKKRLE